MPKKQEYDVAIVGYGPIGEMAAIMLGRRGYRVVAVDRWPGLYPLPRAVVYDDEIARLYQREGVLEDVMAITASVSDAYEWRNRHGDTLLKIDWSTDGPTGRPLVNFFSQPELQKVLDRRARQTPGVDLLLGWALEGLVDSEDEVRLQLRRGEVGDGHRWVATDDVREVSARWVIGADGANSAVREHMGVESEDLGFNFDWLIVDIHPHEERTWSPMNWQLCDPARPTTIVSGGPGRRRWEFMRLPHESIAELNTVKTAWELLEPWGRTPENTTLERHAVYTFQAKWAKGWRQGRLLLAGDAAHLMPPFAGQGMCSGMRDLANLVWKLDLVLRDEAPEALLDTYETERLANVQYFIHLSTALGSVTCVLDEELARQRDERMTAGGGDPAVVLPAGPPPRLGPGVLRDQPVAGLLMPQGRVGRHGQAGLLDTVVPGGFLLLAADAAALSALGADAMAILKSLGASVEHLGDDGLEDLDGVYAAWFAAAADAVAVVVRPDDYVFGAAASAEDVPALVAELGDAIGVRGAAPDGAGAPPAAEGSRQAAATG